MALGENVARAIKAKGYSIHTVETKTGIPHGTIYHCVERDTRKMDIEWIGKIAEFLEISTDELIYGETLHIKPELKGKKVERFGEWVSVEDALPNAHEDVLVYSDKYGQAAGYLSESDKWCFSGMFLTDNISHWMPLPEPPGMEEEEDDQ